MAKQESTKQLVDQLEEAVKTSKELIKYYNDLSKLISESAKSLKEGFGAIDKNTTKGLADFNKLLAQTNKLLNEEEKNNQEKEKTERELIKNQQELSKLKKLQIQEQQAELRLQKQLRTEQEKATKEAEKEAKRIKQENSAYAQKSKQLNELRKEYKDLAAQQEQNTKAGKKLLKQITSLDKELKKIDETVGQNQRSVGDYKKAWEGLNNTIGKLGVGAVIVKGLEMITAAFGDSRNGSEAMAKAFSDLSVRMKVYGQVFGEVASKLVDIFQREGGPLQFLDNLNDGFKTLINGFDGVEGKIEKAQKAQKELIGVSTKYRIEIEALERSIAVLNRTYTTNLQIAENDTLSFETRTKASERARAEALQLIAVETRVASKRLELSAKEIGVKINEDQKKKESALDYANRLREILKDEQKARKISQEDDEAFTQAFVDYQNQRLESTDRYIDTLEKQNKLSSDQQELQLDLQLDLLDNEKTINERRIANDKETFEERKRLIEKTEKEFNELFSDQLKTIIDQRKQVIDTEIERLKLSGDLYTQDIKNLEAQKELLTVENLRNIANEDNVEEQIKQVQALKLGEKFTLRYSETIRDHKTGVQDLTDTQEGLNDSMAEYDAILKDIELQEKKLADSTFDLEKARKEQSEQDLRDRKEQAAEGSLERAKIEQELNELLLEQEEENAQKRLEKRKELIENSIQLIQGAFDKANAKRNKEIEDELTATEKRVDQIRKSAELGNEAAKQSLANEEKKQAELERKKEQQRKREQRQEMLIAGLNLLAENADNPNALGKSISDVTALVGIISSLPTYLKGTEDTGNGGNIDSNGGFLSVLHPNERVLTKEQNKALGGLSNDEVAELGRLHNMNSLEYSPVVVSQNKNLEDKVDKMTRAVETLHQRIPIQRVDYNAKSKEYEHHIQSRNKTEVLRTRAKNIWR